MKTRSFLSLAAAAAMASPAAAQVLVYEPFNYVLDSNIGAVAATGTGLTGNWQRSFTDTATATLRTYATTWTTPTGYAFTASGNGVGTPTDQTNSAAVNLVGAAQVNFDADGTYYYSYLLNYSNVDDRSRVSFGSSGSIDLLRVQSLADGSLRAYAGSTFNSGAALGAGMFLVVGRIDTLATGNDTNTLWVYSSSDTVPSIGGVAYTSASAAITGTANMLQFSNLIDARYGEFRLGSTWGDVAAIPEPSTVAALAGCACLGLAVIRRRSRR